MDRLGGVLEASWAVLGRKRWPTSPQVGSQNGDKIDKKSFQKSIIFLMPLGIDFWKDVGGFWEGKWSQVGTKIDPEFVVCAKAEKSTKH